MVRAQVAIPVHNEPEQESPVSRVARQASPGAVLAAFVLLALGGFASWAIWSADPTRAAIRPADTGTTFLTMFVFAVAVERLLEPFSRWLPGAAALEADGHAAVAHGKANRAVVAWGLASAIAAVASSGSGFYLLHAIAAPGWNGVTIWIDAIVTGLMIGGGTKPLHDLIARMQSLKDSAAK